MTGYWRLRSILRYANQMRIMRFQQVTEGVGLEPVKAEESAAAEPSANLFGL